MSSTNPPERLKYFTYDVFTTSPFSGNPLAIVHIPDSLAPSTETLQLLAREFNYSETVFLFLPPSSPSSYTVRIFLTDAEVPFAGHPVIGTGTHLFTHLLPAGTDTVTLLTKAGKCVLSLTPSGRVQARIPFDGRRHKHDFPPSMVMQQQPRLTEGEVLRSKTLSIVKGMTFVNVELKDLDALGKVGLFSPKLTLDGLDEGWQEGILMMMYYVRTGEGQYRTRMVEGMFEDPATGSASCGLACLLFIMEGDRGDGVRKYDMVQGVEMGRRSEISVEIAFTGGKIDTVDLSGTAVGIMEGTVRYQ